MQHLWGSMGIFKKEDLMDKLKTIYNEKMKKDFGQQVLKNEKLWMDAVFTPYFFARMEKIRVVLYCFTGPTNENGEIDEYRWELWTFDFRNHIQDDINDMGNFHLQDQLIVLPESDFDADNTIEIMYSNSHYTYIDRASTEDRRKILEKKEKEALEGKKKLKQKREEHHRKQTWQPQRKLDRK